MRQHERALASALALRHQFTAYDEPLERVEVFRYLGRLLAMGDTDAQAVRANLKKARRVWARLSRVLRRENASPRTSGRFFQAVVQSVLLYGSESWDLRGALLKQLRGFQLRAAWRMCREHRPQLDEEGKWRYPSRGDVLAEAGLKDIEEYITARCATVARFIAGRPVFESCVSGERRRGTMPRQYWWEQPLGLEDDGPDEAE